MSCDLEGGKEPSSWPKYDCGFSVGEGGEKCVDVKDVGRGYIMLGPHGLW